MSQNAAASGKGEHCAQPKLSSPMMVGAGQQKEDIRTGMFYGTLFQRAVLEEALLCNER